MGWQRAGLRLLRSCALIVSFIWISVSSARAETRLVSNSDREVVIEVLVRDFQLEPVLIDGRAYVRPVLQGGISLPNPGGPQIPVMGELVGIPFGVNVSARLIDADYREHGDVLVAPVPHEQILGGGEAARLTYHANRDDYETDAYLPAEPVVISTTGVMRDQRVAALSIRPVQYNPVRRHLRVATRMRIGLQFSAPGVMPQSVRLPEGRIAPELDRFYHRLLVNGTEAGQWRGRRRGGTDPGLRKASVQWFDPTSAYHKVRITADGIYRLDADWFSDAGIVLQDGDTDRIRLYLDGKEIPLHVQDGGDGVLDDGDGVYFYGRYRTAPDRNFESDYGPENVYWLTVSSGLGLRYQEHDSTPTGGHPEAPWFTWTEHVEEDSIFNPLGLADDVLRDHFYWHEAGSAVGDGNTTPSVVAVPLPGLARDTGLSALVRVAMHGNSAPLNISPDHRTVLQVEGTVVADDRWDGQIAFESSGEVSVSVLRDTTQVALVVPGAPDFPSGYVDQVFLNWVEVTYPRRLEAESGTLIVPIPPGSPAQTYPFTGFETPEILALDVDSGRVFTGLEITADSGGYGARLQLSGGAATLLIAEVGAIRPAPAGEADNGVDLSGDLAGATYLIITHPVFRASADRLAEHRQADGLTALTVEVADIYDAFSYGQTDPEAIRDYVTHAFENWASRPLYLLLLGRASFDYKDLFGQARFGRRPYVPALPYQAAQRGLAFTDHPYGAVAGDDVLPDMFVGRISVNSAGEAETVVDKIIGYDRVPEGRWRDRVLYMATHEDPPIYTAQSDALASTSTELIGLESFKVYNKKDTPPQPNEDTREVIRQINEGRLIVNFVGHGSVATMNKFLSGSYQQGNYSYMSQITNEGRLPLVLAMTCLNGLFADPRILCLAEEMTKKRNGGAIAYISDASLQFNVTNLNMNAEMFRFTFQDSILQFGASLAAAKTAVVSALPVLASTVQGLNLLGDPAQSLAVPGGPDFLLEADALRVETEGEIVAEDTLRIHLRILNAGVMPDTGPVVLLIDRNLDTGAVDTLFSGRLPAFGQTDSVTALWPLAGTAGEHLITASVDPADDIPELDETNNTAEMNLNVFGALSAVAMMPLESQVLAAGSVRLAVRSGAPAQRSPVAIFEVGATPGLDGAEVLRSGTVSGGDGLFVWRSTGLTPGTHYWRARLSEGDETGPWTGVRGFTVGASVPERQLVWRQSGAEALRLGTAQDVALYEDGSVGRVLEPPPIRVDAQGRLASVVADGVEGAAVVCTDGTYLYVKRFHTTPPIYPGSDVFQRIGTGLGGTVAGQNYGVLSDVEVYGVSATYHSDGFIYADDGAQDELVRIAVASGQVDRVRVPDGLLEFQTGLTLGGRSLITSDGHLIYNVASGVAGSRRTGWSVRVFDPGDAWRLVREYQVAPTSTGFTYLHTDGILADGHYLYLIEFGTGLTHHVRVVDAEDGRFVTEYESDQAETDILGGQYDWVNNKVWLGQLNGGTIYQYEGRKLPDSGSLTSATIGPATGFDRVSLSIGGAQSSEEQVVLDVLGEGAGGTFTPLPEWEGLSASGALDLSTLPAGVARIRLRLHLSGGALGASPGLDEWEVAYRPSSNVAISDLSADAAVVSELERVNLSVNVQNRGPLDIVLGTVVAFYSGTPESGRLIGRHAIPEETALGRLTPVTFEWNTAKYAGTNILTARAEDLLGRPSLYSRVVEGAEAVEVTPSGDQAGPTVTITALDAAGEVRTDDYLPSVLRLEVVFLDSSGIDKGTVSVRLAGSAGELSEGIGGDQIRDLTEDDLSLSFIFATNLEDDDYRFEVEGRDQLGNGPAGKALSFKVSSDLRLERVLNVPNPMSTETAFTYILSRPSDVVLRVYTVSGRLVRILENAPGRAGYNQVVWDGRDSEGHLLANGAYLYTVTADDGDRRARVRERLIIYR